jgi:hypothetical protein
MNRLVFFCDFCKEEISDSSIGRAYFPEDDLNIEYRSCCDKCKKEFDTEDQKKRRAHFIK